MLMKDSTAVSNQWCSQSTSWAVQFCLAPGLLSTRSKVINYKYVENSNKIIEIMTRKIDKNQLEPGKGVCLSPPRNWLQARLTVYPRNVQIKTL